VSVSDITKRKQAEEELRSSCEYLERVNDSLGEVIFTIKWPERLIRYVNYSVKHVFGYEIEECLGKNTGFLYPTSEEYQSLGDMLTKAIERGEDSLHAEQLVRRKNGEVFSAEITHTFSKEDGKITQATGILRDITERKHAEKELRVLSRKVVQIQEEERRTIARELHDQIGQSLTLINLLLDKALRPPSKNVASSLNEAKSLVNELVGQIRNLSLSLHPSMLDDLGLLPTLLWYFGTITTKTQVRIEFKHSGLNNCFPQEVKTAAYRIVQEALTNVVRHAKVNRVDVTSWVDQDTLFIRIKDEGAGFDPRALPLGASRGLYGMREWAQSIGGELTVESSLGVGTAITARLPIGHLR
jgi:PAS domain S-box-containing protein